MAWRCSAATLDGLVDNLKRSGLIRSGRVEQAMRHVDRKFFSPRNPYDDSPQGIGYNATISAPHMHAEMLECLLPNLKPGASVLDVGCGSGYLLACFAQLVEDTGTVVGVEHIPQLADLSKNNLQKAGLARDNVVVFGKYLSHCKLTLYLAGDGRKGYPEKAPYDAIHVGAAAPDFPQPLMEQLKIGGRMVIPVDNGGYGQTLWQVDKKSDGSLVKKELMGVIFVPLTDKESQVGV